LVTIRIALVLVTLAVSGALCGQEIGDRIREAQSSGDYAQAANLYLKLIASGSDSPEIRSNCGIMLHLAGRNREGLEQLRIAIRRRPDMAAAQLFTGLTEIDIGEAKAALPYLKRAQELDAKGPAPLLALGKAYVALRQYPAANESYARAAALDPGLAEAWYGAGVTDRSMAEQILNRSAHQGDEDPAQQQRVKELLDAAVKALTRAIEIEPNSARPHLIMAESLADGGKLVEAVPEYQAAIQLDPKLDAGYLGLATAYWKQRQFDDALPPLQRVLEKSPKDAEANGVLADILQHNGDNAGARKHAQVALAANPDLIETRVVLARAYLAEHEPKPAIAELRKIESADRDGSYHFLLYRALREAGDEQAAKQAMAKFQELRYGAPKE
jgi:tetratricopeptide (TPR) repeat protein